LAFDENGRKESECNGLFGKGLTRLDIRRFEAFICKKLWWVNFFKKIQKIYKCLFVSK